jgi:photosystem II stability/assembly factor-like uncharacterized protein
MLLTLVFRAAAVVFCCLPLLAAPAAAAEWVPIGPHLATITDIEAAPSDPRVVYAGTRGGGLYRSLDGGRSWARRNGSGATAQLDLNVWYVAVDPRDAATVYVGTYQSGLFKSVDGGGSWAPIARGVLSYVPTNAWVAVDPVRPRTLYAWYSYLFIRSVDGGATWRRLNLEYEVRDVAGSARAPQVRYAASTNGVYKSTDGGVNWTISNQGLENASVYRIAVDPRRPAELYALGNRPGSQGSSVFRSSDSGRTWRASGRGLPARSYHSAVAVDAQGTAYVSTRLGVYKSLDGGARWQPAKEGLPGVRVSALAAHPQTPSVVWAGTGSGFGPEGGLGVYRTTNGGSSWAASRRGMTGGDVNVLALGTGAVPEIYAGTLSQGVFVRPEGSPGAAWSSRSQGLGSGNVEALLRHPEDPDVLYAAGAAGVYRSEDGGATWSARNQGLANHAGTIPAIYSLAFHAVDPDILYAGADAMIFKSSDGGATWRRTVNAEQFFNTRVQSLATSPDDPAVIYATGEPVDLIAQITLFLKSTDAGEAWSLGGGLSGGRAVADPTDAQVVLSYLGTALQRSTNGGATFTPADIELPLGVGVTAVAFDPASPGVVYAAANGGGADPVTLTFQSLDGGATWNPVDANGIGNSYVLSLAVDEAGAVYAATRGGGVYRLDLP